ncbi:MAG: copper amine oxidase N-terminal domain-containing protein [Thermacetogeniaceae bacterium]
MFKAMLQKRCWFMLALAAAILLCLGSVAISAEDAVKIVVNGKEIASDVPPQIVDGRTLVPLRTVAEALGSQVNWDSATRSVIVNQDAPKLLKVNGEQTTWPYWYEDGNLYLEYHDLIELLRMVYSPGTYAISYSKENNYFIINSAIYKVPVVKRGDYYTLSATYLYANRNFFKFTFDPKTGNITLL